jgi:hypothetical protein
MGSGRTAAGGGSFLSTGRGSLVAGSAFLLVAERFEGIEAAGAAGGDEAGGDAGR